jgi:hypothetical protein
VALDNVHFEGSSLFYYINANLVTFHPIPGGWFDAVSNNYPTLVTPFHIHIPSILRQSQVVIDTKVGSQALKVVHHHCDHQCHNIDQIEHGFYAQDLDAIYCNPLKMASWVGPMRGEIYKKA